ncbi:MAG: 4-(cytidine 5'-diphospho)-2-C-methyl-D-erythritol kinase [Actinomycetota bacterium]
MAEEIREAAPAKINPFLRVLDRRPDGYHDIETLILPISLADELTLTPLDDHLIWVMNVYGEEGGVPVQDAPTSGENLASIAANALRTAIGGEQGARIQIRKRIPFAGGLGGGSADAAATLRALREAWDVHLDEAGLSRVAAEVGSDVPALLGKRACISRGRGEFVQNITLPATHWALITQPFGVRSGDAYDWWDQDGSVVGPDPGPLLESLASGDLERAGELLFNDLEPSVSHRHPEVNHAREHLISAGAIGVVMSGSGPTVAGLARDPAHAEEVATAVGGTVVASFS